MPVLTIQKEKENSARSGSAIIINARRGLDEDIK